MPRATCRQGNYPGWRCRLMRYHEGPCALVPLPLTRAWLQYHLRRRP